MRSACAVLLAGLAGAASIRPGSVSEQPVPPTHVDAMFELRKNSSIPIMADESVFTLSDAWNICTKNAADILSIYPGKHGGISNTIEIEFKNVK
mgnify:CR=1 FL=1